MFSELDAHSTPAPPAAGQTIKHLVHDRAKFYRGIGFQAVRIVPDPTGGCLSRFSDRLLPIRSHAFCRSTVIN